jgi:hypothetical protein
VQHQQLPQAGGSGTVRDGAFFDDASCWARATKPSAICRPRAEYQKRPNWLRRIRWCDCIWLSWKTNPTKTELLLRIRARNRIP